ncbi:hypothetical protein FB451DRAFT_1184760 [Mycena latifolia]|nr:hypothetical protein FB451DRAFT_1184760 [Mycena latifolia]
MREEGFRYYRVESVVLSTSCARSEMARKPNVRGLVSSGCGRNCPHHGRQKKAGAGTIASLHDGGRWYRGARCADDYGMHPNAPKRRDGSRSSRRSQDWELSAFDEHKKKRRRAYTDRLAYAANPALKGCE